MHQKAAVPIEDAFPESLLPAMRVLEQLAWSPTDACLSELVGRRSTPRPAFPIHRQFRACCKCATKCLECRESQLGRGLTDHAPCPRLVEMRARLFSGPIQDLVGIGLCVGLSVLGLRCGGNPASGSIADAGSAADSGAAGAGDASHLGDGVDGPAGQVNGAACATSADCDPTDPCAHACDPVTHRCSDTPVPDGTACLGDWVCCAGKCTSMASNQNCGGCGSACGVDGMGFRESCVSIGTTSSRTACACNTTRFCPRGQACSALPGVHLCTCSDTPDADGPSCAAGQACGVLTAADSVPSCYYPK